MYSRSIGREGVNSMIKDAIRYIYIERRAYCFIAVQLALCVALFTYSLSHVTSARMAIENANNSIQSGRVNIEAHPNNENTSSLVLSNAEIHSLREITNGAFHYTAYCTTAYASGDDVTNAFIMTMDEDELSKDVVYVSSKLFSSLTADIVFFNDSVSAVNGILYYWGHPYEVKPMPESISGRSLITTIDGEAISMDDVLLFSCFSKNVYEDLRKEDHVVTSFSLDDGELSDNGELLWKTLRYLEEIGDGGYTFSVGSLIQEAAKYHNYSVMIPAYLGETGILLLLIAALGMIGAMRMILRKRARDYAIRLALGATEWELIRGSTCEVMILILTGGIIGCIIGAVAVKKYPFDTMFPVKLSCSVIATDMLILLILTAAMVIPVCVRIMRLCISDLLHCN